MEVTYEFQARHTQRIKLPSDKSVGFKWSNLIGKAPRGVILPDGSAEESIKTNVHQEGDMFDATNYTDKPATLTLYLPV